MSDEASSSSSSSVVTLVPYVRENGRPIRLGILRWGKTGTCDRGSGEGGSGDRGNVRLRAHPPERLSRLIWALGSETARQGVCAMLWVRVRRAPRTEVDWGWERRLGYWLGRWLELERGLWWLSTLGGAYSALGDYWTSAVSAAACVSLRQWRLARELGDRVLESRCRLYLALALAQSRRFSDAERIVRAEWKNSRRLNSQLLRNAAAGVWAKIRADYHRYRPTPSPIDA